jgi:beta-lactamase class D
MKDDELLTFVEQFRLLTRMANERLPAATATTTATRRSSTVRRGRHWCASRARGTTRSRSNACPWTAPAAWPVPW